MHPECQLEVHFLVIHSVQHFMMIHTEHKWGQVPLRGVRESPIGSVFLLLAICQGHSGKVAKVTLRFFSILFPSPETDGLRTPGIARAACAGAGGKISRLSLAMVETRTPLH